MFECPYCKTRQMNPNQDKAEKNCEFYGSSRFYFRCSNVACKKVFSVYIRRQVVMGKAEECSQEQLPSWGN